MVALWILLPLALLHLALLRRRELLRFQILLDVLLLLLPGRLLLTGGHLVPGVPGAAAWGTATTVAGSPEQTDLPLQLAPWWEETRRLIAGGYPPWISDRIGGGTALYAHGQSGLPFPLQLPVLVLGAERGSDVMAVAKLEVAALGMFFLLRRLRLVASAAVIGAVAFPFGLYVLSWLVSPLSWVLAGAPWAFWLEIGTLRGRRREAAALAVLLGVLAGWSVNPETAAFLWFGLGVAGSVVALGRWRRLRRLALPFLLAVPVAAVGAVPTVLAIRESSKYEALADGPIYPASDLSWSLKARVAALTLTPWREGHPADGSWDLGFPAAPVSLSVTSVAVALVLLGCRRRHRRWRAAMVAMAAIAAGMVFQLPVLSQVLGRLPVLGVMTWVRIGFLVSLALAVAAAIGADSWLRRPRRRRLVAATVAVALVSSGLASTAAGAGHRRLAWRTAWAPLAAAAAAPVAGGAVLIGLVVGETLAAGWNVLPLSRPGREPDGGVLAALRTLQAAEGGRVLGVANSLPPNLAVRCGLSDLRAHDPVRAVSLARLHEAFGAVGPELAGPVTRPWAGLAGAWGVRWLVTPPGGVDERWAAGWDEVYQGADGRVYRNRRCLAELRLASIVVEPPGDPFDGAFEALDLFRTAVMTEPVRLGGNGKVDVVRQQPSRVTAKVAADGGVLAVLHVPRAPGWTAFLDGRPAAIVDADIAAMAILVPAGEHEVGWVYTPPGLMMGAMLTVVGLLGCAVLAFSRGRGTWAGH